MNETYRLKVSTIAIESKAGKPSPVVIPAGAVLEHLGDESGFARCAWHGNEVQILILDLKERGERVRDARK